MGRRVKPEITEFVTKWAEGIVARTIEVQPSESDCLLCMWRGPDLAPLGEFYGDASHIIGHIEEGYYVPSLLVRALVKFPASPVTNTYVFQGKDFGWNMNDLIMRQLRSSLKRYIISQLKDEAYIVPETSMRRR